MRIAHGTVTQRAGTNDKAIRIVFTNPTVKDILIPYKICGSVSFRSAGHGKHISLVHKLDGINIHAVFVAEGKYFLGLYQIKRPAVRMVTCAVAYRDKQFAVYGIYKIKDAEPLFLCQYAGISIRSLAACRSVKIVIGFLLPRNRRRESKRIQALLHAYAVFNRTN